MKFTLTISLFFISFLGFSQQIVKESIDSGGGAASATGIKIVHTIGEVVVAEKSNGTLHVSEGFISPEFASYLDVENYTALGGVKAYPNPTMAVVNITFPEPQNYLIQVFDILGREVLQVRTDNVDNYLLNISNLQAETYMVLVKNTNSRQFKTFKIVKE